jgi:hypothetical protein
MGNNTYNDIIAHYCLRLLDEEKVPVASGRGSEGGNGLIQRRTQDK